MDAPLLEAVQVGKRYCRHWRRGLWYAVQDGLKRSVGGQPSAAPLRPNEFWAVRDVSLQLRRGECLGVLGPNGAGKSTLLKMLSGAVLPDTGKIRVRGRLSALLDVGAGLQPLLTGRENIQAFAAQRGIGSAELAANFDAIVAFAELSADQLDQPVKHYSNGMQTRLGFALLAQFPSEVILLDEILAMSDARFRARCLGRLPQLLERAAVVWVSHSMAQVARVTNRILVLDQGVCRYYGAEVAAGIDAYYAACAADLPASLSGDGRAQLHAHTLYADGVPLDAAALQQGQVLSLSLDLSVRDAYAATISVWLSNPELHSLLQCDSAYSAFQLPADAQIHRVRLDLGAVPLNPGWYGLSLAVSDAARGDVLLRHEHFAALRVAGPDCGHAPLQLQGAWKRLDNSIDA